MTEQSLPPVLEPMPVLSPEQELVELRKAHKRLLRQHTALQGVLENSKTAARARANLDAVFAVEKALQEQYLVLLLKNSPNIILIFDADSRFVYCSSAFLQWVGLAGAGLVKGRKFREVAEGRIDEVRLAEIEAVLRECLSEGYTLTLERPVRSNFCGERNYRMLFTPMMGALGATEGALAMFHDVTDLMLAREEAERASQAKSDFLSNMSHEMRTPMNAIIGMTHMAKNVDDVEKKAYCLNRIHEASTHLLGVINDILDMAKIEANRLELNLAPFDLECLFVRVSHVLGFRLDEKRQRFALRVSPNLPRNVVSDEQRLAQVITNLLSNANKFTPEDGSITLAAELAQMENEACMIRVSVVDTGIGLSDEQVQRLFIPFAQADSGISRKYGGTGLGLAISRRIVEMLGGTLDVTSQPGAGCCFSFTARLGLDPSAPDGAQAAADNCMPSDLAEYTGCFAGLRVLLAEDVAINREVAAALLEDTGLVIDWAENGLEAFQMAANGLDDYDLILMDIQMPEMDGYTATRQIRALPSPKAATIPIVAMTANVFREDVEKCLACGMNDHLGKPLDVDQIVCTLRRYLSGSAKA